LAAWLRRAVQAARIAADRADLWPAGALATLAFPGWLAFLLVVAPPDPGDLVFVASSLRGSSAFPYNVIVLCAAIVGGAVLLCLLAAVAEAALPRMAQADRSHPPLASSALVGLTITLIAALPAALATAALLLGLVALAPAEFTSPDLGIPLAVRLARDLLPFVVALVLAVLLGQAIGGVALRRALGSEGRLVGAALADAGRDLAHHPWSRIGVAGVGLLADAVAVALTYALLRVLWAPIGAQLAVGRLTSPDTLLLLVGFVAIWLALLLAAGALHVTISAWWALELAHSESGSRGATVQREPDARGGSTDDARHLR
jgi:hypothetical protein